jgi:hypothetical protein
MDLVYYYYYYLLIIDPCFSDKRDCCIVSTYVVGYIV